MQQLQSPRHKKIKTIRYFIIFLNFDLAKRGFDLTLSPLAHPLVAPLLTVITHDGLVRINMQYFT